MQCGNCKHWSAGECFRYPPMVTLYPNDNQHPIMYAPMNWRPPVAASERACGEYVYISRGG